MSDDGLPPLWTSLSSLETTTTKLSKHIRKTIDRKVIKMAGLEPIDESTSFKTPREKKDKQKRPYTTVTETVLPLHVYASQNPACIFKFVKRVRQKNNADCT